jgi:hypothetical protein
MMLALPYLLLIHLGGRAILTHTLLAVTDQLYTVSPVLGQYCVGFGWVVWGAFGFVVTLELFAPVRNHFFLGWFLSGLGCRFECSSRRDDLFLRDVPYFHRYRLLCAYALQRYLHINRVLVWVLALSYFLSSGREVECRCASRTEGNFYHLGIIWVDVKRCT